MECKVRMYSDGEFPINEGLAGIVPMATQAEQEALTMDIQENGLKEPIVLYKGKVVDGRCRMKALRLLKQSIAYKELDDSLTTDEVEIYVKSVNTRRNLTLAQKAISAAYAYLKPNNVLSISKMAKSWGLGEKTLKFALHITKVAPKVAKELFNGNSVEIVNMNGKNVYSTKVSAVYEWLKRRDEVVVKGKDITTDVTDTIRTQAGRDWYKRQVDNGEYTVQSALAELANYKFNK